ncbi:MAG TPA: monovalent cation:proton antiporter-2 (CPA2) family protein [Burkholderiales bacterium]|nr:monovalent cation:proton antiporter-2 (CPA2) family protein [Burkholderiales bacterium]
MHEVGTSLLPVLVLLAASVLAVTLCRRLSLPPIIGYLATGLVLGPHAFGLIADTEQTRRLAEFGVVFLMFSIGLEFSMPRLMAMRRVVFGLGFAQVLATVSLCVAAAAAFGGSWQAGVALGGAAAMSSTAIVSRLLAERMELDTPHGREVVGVLLFQDLAVVPLLILVPALGHPAGEIGAAIALALAKAALALGVLVLVGSRAMRAWLGLVARRRSTELFVLNVLLVTLTLAFITELAGLSLALGAFLAGMLISETEYRYQVEEDIKPFRDVLLGLFFVTVGMTLDMRLVLGEPALVLLLLTLLMGAKFGLIALLSRVFGSPPGTALRVGLGLAQGGEFGFVLIALAHRNAVAPESILHALLAAMILSMLATPFVIAASNRIVMRLARSEWMLRSLELHRIAVQAIESERHVIILGYGRNGQHLARMLDAEKVRYVALDLDPERVREAALAGDTVVFADCARREALVAAGISRAAAVVVTFADAAAAARVLANIHDLNPAVPVIVRAHGERDIERLTAAGASEVVPEAFESGLMLASHTLIWIGVPLTRVVRRMRQVRDQQYGLLRGLFRGPSDEAEVGEELAPRLHAVTLTPGAYGVGRSLEELKLEDTSVEVKAVRRPGARGRLAPQDAGRLEAGDVVVLLGAPEMIALAEARLLQG